MHGRRELKGKKWEDVCEVESRLKRQGSQKLCEEVEKEREPRGIERGPLLFDCQFEDMKCMGQKPARVRLKYLKRTDDRIQICHPRELQ